MKTAFYNQQKLHLDRYNRDNLQFLHDEGKKGLLTCSVCGEPVRLFLGIQAEPYFFHHLKKRHCSDDQKDISYINTPTEEQFTETSGFRLPKSRAIATVENEEKTVFKAFHQVAPLHKFVYEKASTNDTLQDSYINSLSNANVILDSQQIEAVLFNDGPLLVLAGAGSGKTRVLTSRTAYLLARKQVAPESIMLVTFTTKAAAEMKSRLSSYPELHRNQIQNLVSGTFHSIFYRILMFHEKDKWRTDKLLKYRWQQEQLLKEVGKEIELDEKEFAFDLALQQISFWKNSLVMPEETRPNSPWEEKVAFLYKGYEHQKSLKELFDFDDMLIGCMKLLKGSPEILEVYQKRFAYFLIDEFQDVNRVQYDLIKLLSARTNNICAVGDDDQSIYSFRGSDPSYLLDFEHDYPGLKKVILNQNYRSSHEIVDFANRIISENKRRHQKNMQAQSCSNRPPVLFYPYDEEEEATMILTDMQAKIAAGSHPGDFAILFRTNSGSRAIFERLANSSLPFVIDQDIDSFYERFTIRSVLACLKMSLDEDDMSAVNHIMPLLFLKQAALRDIKAESILNDCSLLEAVSTLKTGFAFQERRLKKFPTLIRSLAPLSPVTAIDFVEKELGLGDFLKKRGNEGNQFDKGSDDLKDLKVVAKKFKTIRELIEHSEHMAAMNKEIKRTSKDLTNAITLSTIHRSKGLEYKIVYVIGAVDGGLPHDHALESLRNGDFTQLEEERRLLYVAVTRAMDEVYLSIPQTRRGKKAKPSRFLVY